MTDRAVSTVVGYIVTLGITSLLVTGLLIAGGNFVQDQRESTIREELEVVGQRLSGDVSAADRLGQVGSSGDATIRRSVPATAAGASYTIRLTDAGGDPQIVLTSSNPEVTVSVPVALSDGTVVVESEISAGDVVIEFSASPDEVTISGG